MRLYIAILFAALVAVSGAQALPRRAVLGAGLRPVPPPKLTELKLQPGHAAEVFAAQGTTLPGDLKEGDILIEIGGKKFTNNPELNALLRDLRAGQPVSLTVLADGKTVKRTVTPQERPKDPGDATYEMVYDHVVSKGNRIRTLISKPKGVTGKRPVLFWIQGIGASTIDFPMTSPSTVMKVIKAFSDDGYVTVRVEKPGIGDSEGGPAHLVGWLEENDIYRQALKALDKYDFVDRSRVYVFGHSMGGCHAPVLLSEIPVKGVITYGTVSDSWLEWQIKAARFQSQLGGGDPAEIHRAVQQTVLFYNELYNEKKSIEQIRKEHPQLEEYIKQASPDGKEMLSTRSVKYMVELNDHNFSDYWSRIGDAQVLALFGENDFVALEADNSQIAWVVNKKKAGQATFMKVKESDHGFTKTTSMEDSRAKWGRPGNEFSPEVVRVMKEWIKTIESKG